MARKPRKMTIADKVEHQSVLVDNPFYSRDHIEAGSNPRKIWATKNVRESAVETLYARGKLDEAQKVTADRFRAHWEACGGSIGAMDYGREPVDGGGARDPLSARQAEAGRELARCRTLLGARMFALVCQVCGEGRALQEVVAVKRGQLTAADNLRGSLDDLAEMWGIVSISMNKRRAAVR